MTDENNGLDLTPVDDDTQDVPAVAPEPPQEAPQELEVTTEPGPLDEARPLSANAKEWCEEIAKKCAGGGKPNLSDRLLAMQLEASEWVMDGKIDRKSGGSFKAHTIQKVTREVNYLLWKYRCNLVNTMTVHTRPAMLVGVDGVVKDTVSCNVRFRLSCAATDESIEFEWGGEGRDITNAGSYAVKYGLMRGLLHVGDGEDPDAVANDAPVSNVSRPNTQTTRTTVSKPTPTKSEPAKNGSNSDYEALLVKLCDPSLGLAGWFPVKASQLYKGKVAKGEKEREAFDNLFVQIEAAHKKKCGDNCEHIKSAKEVVA